MSLDAVAEESNVSDCADLLAVNEMPALTDEQFKARRTPLLCAFKEWGVTVRSGLHSHRNTLRTGDLSQILNLFPDDPSMRQSFHDVIITLVPVEPSVWRVEFVDRSGQPVQAISDYYVWSRENSPFVQRAMQRAGVTQDRSRNLDFSPSRVIRCNRIEDGNGCVTYLHAPDCTDPLELDKEFTAVKAPIFIAGLDNKRSRSDMLRNMEDIFAIMERYARAAIRLECIEDRLQ